MFALASFLQPELQYPTLSEDFFILLVLILLCLVVRTESEGGGRELGVWASIGQDHHLPRQEPGEAGQEHLLQEQSLGEISGSNCNPGLRIWTINRALSIFPPTVTCRASSCDCHGKTMEEDATQSATYASCTHSGVICHPSFS